MRQEWYEYATSLKEQIAKIEKMLAFHICTFILLGLYAAGVFFVNKIAFFMIVPSYIALFIYNQKEKDDYAQKIFSIGTFILYMVLEMSVIMGLLDFCRQCLWVMMPLCAVFYEIKVLIGVKGKNYSSKHTKVSNAVYSFLTLISGTTIGLTLGEIMGSVLQDSPFLFVLIAIVLSLLFVCAIMYLQRYVVYKWLRSKSK